MDCTSLFPRHCVFWFIKYKGSLKKQLLDWVEMCVDHLPACLGLVMLQIWMCRTKPDVPLKSKMIQKNMFCCKNRTPSRLHPHFTMLFGVNFRESLRVWPLLRGQNLKCTSTSWINHTNLTCSKATRISVIWLYMYIEYTHPANMCVCVCVL